MLQRINELTPHELRTSELNKALATVQGETTTGHEAVLAALCLQLLNHIAFRENEIAALSTKYSPSNIATAIQKYTQVLKAEGKREFGEKMSLDHADLSHSALFQRLLDQKEPLPKPPPKAFSYPWYSLIDDGKDNACEVHSYDETSKRIVINQNSAWIVTEKRSDDEYIVHYHYWLECRAVRTDPARPFGWTLTVIRNDYKNDQCPT